MAGQKETVHIRYGLDVLGDDPELSGVMLALGQMVAAHARCEMEMTAFVAALLHGQRGVGDINVASLMLSVTRSPSLRTKLVKALAAYEIRGERLAPHKQKRLLDLTREFARLSAERDLFVHRPLARVRCEGVTETLVLVRPELIDWSAFDNKNGEGKRDPAIKSSDETMAEKLAEYIENNTVTASIIRDLAARLVAWREDVVRETKALRDM